MIRFQTLGALGLWRAPTARSSVPCSRSPSCATTRFHRVPAVKDQRRARRRCSCDEVACGGGVDAGARAVLVSFDSVVQHHDVVVSP